MNPRHDDDFDALDQFGRALFPQRPAACPDAASLQAFAAHALPDYLAASIQAHLDSCPSCRHLATDLATLALELPSPGDLSHLRRRFEHKRNAHRPARRFFWPAAAAAAALALAYIPYRTLQSPVEPPPLRAAAIPAPAFHLEPLSRLRPPAVRLPLAGLLLWRDSTPAAIPLEVRALAQALEPFRTANYQQAADALAPLTTGPLAAQASFYHGVSLLFLNQPAQALAPLQRALAAPDPNLQSDARWYLAHAHLRLNQFAQAHPLLLQSCHAGPHAADACALLAAWSQPAFPSPQR